MCINPIKIINKTTGEEETVACGKCIICRYKKCRTWALRLYHESQYHKKMCMLTLTFKPAFLLRPKIKELTKTKRYYDENKIPKIKKIKYTTMINPNYILNVKKTGWLVTLFMKKLRKKLQKQNIYISYFAIGEHGSKNTHRAHWHIILFDCDKEILNSVSIGKSKKNKEIYFSPIIDKLWSYERMKIGNHTISDVTSATIKYVANYTLKKMYNNNNGTYPTTMRFSNRNKIGIKWARRFHRELRKDYLKDQDGIKYTIPKGYYNEMIRFQGEFDNKELEKTAEIIELNKDKLINKLKKAGLLKLEEIKKKATKLEKRISKEERDTF